MKTWTFEVKINEGYDKFWEDLNELPNQIEKNLYLQSELLEILHYYGFINNIEIKLLSFNEVSEKSEKI